MQHFLVFGSHPRLSLAEAKAVLGGRMPTLVGPVALLAETESWDGAWVQERLAGTIKLGDVLFSCPLKELEVDKIVAALPTREGTSKLTFAVTTYGVPAITFQRLPLELKKAMKMFGRSVRWFADEQGEVSPAAVAKLGLTTEGYDLVIAVERGVAHVCLTTHVQNADAWSLRDYGRPARDSKNGMLPPKLARMMVNLGIGTARGSNPSALRAPPLTLRGRSESISELDSPFTILDPFCGSGTVLMEAALMEQEAKIIGSDIDAKQVTDTNQNLDWMVEQKLISGEQRETISCFPHDVRVIDRFIHEPVELVVTEGFLGTPLRGHEPALYLEREVRAISELWRETLASLAKVQPPGGVLVGIWPILQTPHGMAAVDLSTTVGQFGYELVNPLEGWGTGTQELVYARVDQLVKRRVVVLRRA